MRREIVSDRAPGENDFKDWLNCPRCFEKLFDDDYEFMDVESDFHGRDVITMKCLKCGETGTSFVYINRNAGT